MPTHVGPDRPASARSWYADLAESRVADGIRVDTRFFGPERCSMSATSQRAVPLMSNWSARTIATVAGRVMNAVWRNNNLYTCNTIKPTVGVDLPQATAHWYRIDTVALAALAIADQGNVGAEDLGAATHTMMPAVNVDKCDNMAIGFSASGPTIYAGAYYATRLLTDPAGTIGATMPLALGLDPTSAPSGNTAASRQDGSGLSARWTSRLSFTTSTRARTAT
jgi:hypothetical protein